jgi:hypothetical protein
MNSMNPNSSESVGAQLPVPEQLPESVSGTETGVSGLPEQAPGMAEKAPQPGASSVAMPPITLLLPPTGPTDNSQPAVPPAQPAINATVVDDGDLIEKEWVNKAKQIVEANRNDPYKQSEELTVFKADYMKKRYDKNIKLSE